MSLEKAIERAKQLRFDGAEYIGQYKGQKAYSCYLDSNKKNICIGYPVFLLEKSEDEYETAKFDEMWELMLHKY